MEVCRLTPEQLERLQNHEKKERVGQDFDALTGTFRKFTDRMRRCLNPLEIQECFNICTLKEEYGIPVDNDAAQADNNVRLRKEFKRLNLIPQGEGSWYEGSGMDWSVIAVDKIHEFDHKVTEAHATMQLDLNHLGRSSQKKKLREEVDNQ